MQEKFNDFNDIVDFCQKLSHEFGYGEINIPILENKRFKRTLGQVSYKPAFTRKFDKDGMAIYEYTPEKIQFASDLLCMDQHTIEDTIRHELAHYFVGLDTHESHGHDEVWKAMAVKVGAEPSSTSANMQYKREKLLLKKEYLIVCPECGTVFNHYKTHCKKVQQVENGRHVCSKCNKTLVVEKG